MFFPLFNGGLNGKIDHRLAKSFGQVEVGLEIWIPTGFDS